MFRGTEAARTIGFFLDDVGGTGSRDPVNLSLAQQSSLAYFSLNHTRVPPNGWSGGGRFKTAYSGYDHSPSGEIVVMGYNGRPSYQGRFISRIPPAYPFPGDRNIAAYGPELYHEAMPAKPEMDLANALYELKDVPAMLRQRFLSNGLHAIGDYFLALKFGWEPLLRDTRSFYQMHRNMHKNLGQLLRDNGKPVRRRVRKSIPEVRTTLWDNRPNTIQGGLYPTLITHWYGDVSHTHSLAEHVQSLEVWLSARFRYYLPPKGGMTDWEWKNWMVARLYGLNPTPSTVYQAIPWSWLIDWFSTAGDAIANMDAGVADRLWSDYAYVMGHQQDYVQYTESGAFKLQGGGESVVTASAKWGYFSKERVPASPFGFFIKNEDLKPVQWEILGAIGSGRLR
jgi:hypothetical protein